MLKSTLLFAIIALNSSCVSFTRTVTTEELETRLKKDTAQGEENGLGHQWSYLGSDDKLHYFDRQVMAMFRYDFHDGIYKLRKESIDVSPFLFTRPLKDTLTRKSHPAFTRIDSVNGKTDYNISYGVLNNWADLTKNHETQAQ